MPMATSPRVFVVRHGETEWSLSGKHTGYTDITLTPRGEQRVTCHCTRGDRSSNGDFIHPLTLPAPAAQEQKYLNSLTTPWLCRSLVSPRKRAQRTLELLNLGIVDGLPWTAHGHAACDGLACADQVEVTEAIREWDYGDYEGMTSHEVGSLRADQGHQGVWDIWRDGCPGGEPTTDVELREIRSPTQVTQRLDTLIAQIRDKWHRPAHE